MNAPSEVSVAAKIQSLTSAVESAQSGRGGDAVIALVAAIAEVNVLSIGPMGTGKTELFDIFVKALPKPWVAFDNGEQSIFQEQLNAYSELEDVFGPVDLAEFREGTYQRVDGGGIQPSTVAMIDEVDKGSPAVQNAMLGVTHPRERSMRDNGQRHKLPLKFAYLTGNFEEDIAPAFLGRCFLRIPTKIDGGVKNGRKMFARNAKRYGGDEASLEVNIPRFSLFDFARIKRRAAELSGNASPAFVDLWDGLMVKLRTATLRDDCRLSPRDEEMLSWLLCIFAALMGADKLESKHLGFLIYGPWSNRSLAKCKRDIIESAGATKVTDKTVDISKLSPEDRLLYTVLYRVAPLPTVKESLESNRAYFGS